MASNEYLNLKEAARYLGVSDIKIRRLITNGFLKVSSDPLDDRKRLVKKKELDSLKIPRPINHITTIRHGKVKKSLDLKKKQDNSLPKV